MDEYEKQITLSEYWATFLGTTGRAEDQMCSGELSFDNSLGTSSAADAKVIATLNGGKRAFFSCLDTFLVDNDPLPSSGELYIVTDSAGYPRCVIELTSVTRVPFNEVTMEMVKSDGEDETLTDWRAKMTEYLSDEADVVGFNFSPRTVLLYQTFNVVYK